MRLAIALSGVFIATTAFAGERPLPPKTAIDSAKRLVAETFRKELSESDKTLAVKAMLETAAKTEGDYAAQAALYLSAAEVAARSGDTRQAFDAIDKLLVVFDIDEFEAKGSVLELAAENAKTSEARISVANRGLELADAALAAGRFDGADSALKTAAKASSKLRDTEVRKEIAVKRRDVEKARKQAAHVETELADARKKLNANPSDPAANEAVGKYLAFDRNDWSTGLKHLIKSPDAQLRKIAKADQAGAADPNQMAALGDLWWTLADGADAQRDQRGFRSRAVFWYTRAAAQLKGFAKARVEKRVAEAGEEALAAAAEQTGGDNGKFIDIVLAPGVLMRLVKIPASADGKVKEFYLGQTEVTQKQWVALMGSNPSQIQGLNLPVGSVSIRECEQFLKQLGEHARRMSFRLPTEQEYRFATLAGEGYESIAKRITKVAWIKDNADGKLHDVAQLEPNAWGLYDILGNSWEWMPGNSVWGGAIWLTAGSFTKGPPNGSHDTDRDHSIGLRVAADPL